MPRNLNDTCPYQDVHPNCFALLHNGKCYALSDTAFYTDKCPFYKTDNKIDPRVLRRIKNLQKGLKKAWESPY